LVRGTAKAAQPKLPVPSINIKLKEVKQKIRWETIFECRRANMVSWDKKQRLRLAKMVINGKPTAYIKSVVDEGILCTEPRYQNTSDSDLKMICGDVLTSRRRGLECRRFGDTAVSVL
jgi:hypothetical protein